MKTGSRSPASCAGRASRLCFSAALLAGCATASLPAHAIPSAPLVGVDGSSLDARSWTARAPLTVFVFFSTHCHCLDVHDGRLRALEGAYRPRGVQFVMVDSEVDGSPALDAEQAKRRGYRFPIVRDRGAKLADAVGAEYATYTVVADVEGRIRYRGGIDSDKIHLHEDASRYLQDALDDLLAARPPRLSEGKTLGCALMKE
jgi:hypothetical protein